MTGYAVVCCRWHWFDRSVACFTLCATVSLAASNNLMIYYAARCDVKIKRPSNCLNNLYNQFRQKLSLPTRRNRHMLQFTVIEQFTLGQ